MTKHDNVVAFRQQEDRKDISDRLMEMFFTIDRIKDPDLQALKFSEWYNSVRRYENRFIQ